MTLIRAARLTFMGMTVTAGAAHAETQTFRGLCTGQRNVVSELGKQLMAGCEIDVKPTFGAPSP
jgi:hypothetical protein